MDSSHPVIFTNINSQKTNQVCHAITVSANWETRPFLHPDNEPIVKSNTFQSPVWKITKRWREAAFQLWHNNMLNFTHPEEGQTRFINVTDPSILINASWQVIHRTEKILPSSTKDGSDLQLFIASEGATPPWEKKGFLFKKTKSGCSLILERRI